MLCHYLLDKMLHAYLKFCPVVIDTQLMPWGDLEQILLKLCGIK
ncbi:hypothetical protein [Vibrio chagasii]